MPQPSAPPIALEDVRIALPDGRPVIEPDLALMRARARFAQRAFGLGKVDAVPRDLRHLALWRGRIRTPEGDHVMVVPQKPYIPIGSLRAAVTYPAVPGAYPDDDIRKALVGCASCAISPANLIARTCGRNASRAASSSGSRWPAPC